MHPEKQPTPNSQFGKSRAAAIGLAVLACLAWAITVVYSTSPESGWSALVNNALFMFPAPTFMGLSYGWLGVYSWVMLLGIALLAILLVKGPATAKTLVLPFGVVACSSLVIFGCYAYWGWSTSEVTSVLSTFLTYGMAGSSIVLLALRVAVFVLVVVAWKVARSRRAIAFVLVALCVVALATFALGAAPYVLPSANFVAGATALASAKTYFVSWLIADVALWASAALVLFRDREK